VDTFPVSRVVTQVGLSPLILWATYRLRSLPSAKERSLAEVLAGDKQAQTDGNPSDSVTPEGTPPPSEFEAGPQPKLLQVTW